MNSRTYPTTYLEYIAKRLLYGTKKADFVNYPLFVKPADLKLHRDSVQRPGIRRLMRKLQDGTYRRNKSRCLCGNSDTRLDEAISRLEMHGINLDVLLCRKCGLIRSADVFDAQSNADYYRYEYREILADGSVDFENFFMSQADRGIHFLDILHSTGITGKIESVVEIGCGSGGVLYPFHSIGKKVSGYDYDDEYLEYGRHKGMEMVCVGENSTSIPHTEPDLLILSHVVEHFLNPKNELTQYIGKVKPGKYLLIEVPGIFCSSIKKELHGYPVRYFQLAHVIQFFYCEYLELFYKALGLEIIYGDEAATFVLKKPLHWEPAVPGDIFSDRLSKYPPLIDSYLKETFFDYRYRPGRDNLVWFCSSMLERIGLRKALKRLVKRSKSRLPAA
jgi:SAM-dependent methyltransferase